MQQSRLPTLFVAYLSGILTCVMMSCAGGPKVRVHISDPGKSGMEYYDERTNQSGFVSYSDTDKFICFNPNDFSLVLNYCRLQKP